MPWRGPEIPGEFPTLGYQVGDYIESACVIPDGDLVGEPYRLTDEMWRFLIWFYRLDPGSGGFVFRRGQLVEPQKWGKGPFSSAMVCAEADGPVLFDGWDAAGEPVGRPWTTPWIQITAVSEDQTDNVWRALQPMIELGPLQADMPDTGLTRINLPGGGIIEPVTASARSRLGQRITFAVQDEPHSWLETNGGWRLADNQRRNLAGMKGRSVETTNAWDPAEQSVAQRTAESKAAGIYRQHPTPPDHLVQQIKDAARQDRMMSQSTLRNVRKILDIAYGDSWWVDKERILAEFLELAERDLAQALRFFGNVVVVGTDVWLDVDQKWVPLASPRTVPAGTKITVGFDGARYDDQLAIRAVTEDGYRFTPTVGADGKPAIWDPHQHGGEIPEAEVDAAIHEIMTRFDVVLGYFDPHYWQSEVGAWSVEWPDTVKQWDTRRTRLMSDALERSHTDITAGNVTHDGCPVTEQHYRNARKERRRGGTVITKDHPNSPRKIDAAMADTLASEARADALTSGRFVRRRRSRILVSTSGG